MLRWWNLMRYFTFIDQNKTAKDKYITMSEEEILDFYYPHWYKQMCGKFGKEHVDETYCKQDCLEDWVVINRAWESHIKDSNL